MKLFSVFVCGVLAFAPILPAMAQHGTNAADRTFVTNAATANVAEIGEGQIESRSHDANAAMFGARMVRDHGKALVQLKLLAQELGLLPAFEHGVKMAPPAVTIPPKQYLVHEVSDHQTTIALFEREAAQGQNASLRAYARTALPMLRAHLELAQRLTGTP